MPAERGSGIGMSASIGGSKGGGVATASRGLGSISSRGEVSLRTSFSSRGLESFGKSSIGKTSTPGLPSIRLGMGNPNKPSLSFGSERSKFSGAGKTEKASLSMKDIAASKGPSASRKVEIRVANTPQIKATKAESSIQPEKNSHMPTPAITLGPEKANGIQVAEVMAQPKSPVYPEVKLQNPVAKQTESVAQVPSVKPVETMQPQVEQKIASVVSEAASPKVESLARVKVVQDVLEVIKNDPITLPKPEKIIHPVTPVFRPTPRVEVKMQASEAALIPEKKPNEQQPKPEAKAEPLSRLVYLEPLKYEKDEEKKKKAEAREEEIGRIERSYVTFGIAKTPQEARLKVERYLQKDPAFLANNPALEPQQIKPSPALRPKQEEIVVPVEKTKAQPESSVAVASTSKTESSIKEKVKTKIKQIVTAKIKERSEIRKEYKFKLDETAQNNRLKEWNDAVRQVFPMFKYDFQAPLSAVAAVLKPPSRPTDSELIKKMEKKVDGSNKGSDDWRTPLQSNETLVFASDARTIGEYEIFSKPAVTIKEEGQDVHQKDVERVLSGSDIDSLGNIEA